MVLELLLGGAAVVMIGTVWYVFREHRRLAEVEERERREARALFRTALLREMKGRKLADFHFATFMTESGMSRQEADLAASELYEEYVGKFIAEQQLDLLKHPVTPSVQDRRHQRSPAI